MKIKIVIALLLLVVFSCKKQLTTTPTNMSHNEDTNINKNYDIHFGTGGGVTGKKYEYKINKNGEVFTINKQDTTFLKSLDKETTDLCFNKIHSLEWPIYPINKPGNIFYFINIPSEKKKIMYWGDPTYEVPESFKECYLLLNTLVKK